jgi:hypothetical protein
MKGALDNPFQARLLDGIRDRFFQNGIEDLHEAGILHIGGKNIALGDPDETLLDGVLNLFRKLQKRENVFD